MTATIDFGNYCYVPGFFQYSAGVSALPGFAITRVRFADPVPLAAGFQRIEAHLRAAGVPLTAFCACELRSPSQFTDQGFIDFNRMYVGTLAKWGIFADEKNPVARSNVCPKIDPPSEPSFHAFCYAAPATGAAPSWVCAGSGEAREGTGPYSEKIVRLGETDMDAMQEKARFVLGVMESRMKALGTSWTAATGVQVYTVHDIYPCLADDIVRRGATRHGLTWHFCRPPVVGLEYEMDCRSVATELVI